MNSVEGKYKVLEMHNIPRLNQEEVENMNRLITSSEIESVIKKQSIKQTGPDTFMYELYQISKKL